MRGDRSKPARRDAHTSPGACNEPLPHFPTSLANLNAVIFKCKGLCGAGRGIFLLSSCVNATASRPSDGGSDSPGGPGWLDVAAPGSAGGEGGGGAAGWSRRGSSRFPPLSRRFWRVKKIRESQSVCKEPVNTLGADLGEGGLLLVRVYRCKAGLAACSGMRHMGEGAAKRRFLGDSLVIELSLAQLWPPAGAKYVYAAKPLAGSAAKGAGNACADKGSASSPS